MERNGCSWDMERNGRSWEEVAADIKRCTKRALSHNERMQEQVRIDTIIRVAPKSWYYKIKTGRIDTLDDAVERIRLVEARIKDAEKQEEQVRKASSSLEEKIKALEKELSQFKNPTKSDSSTGIECWLCGQRGHIRRECPRRNQALSWNMMTTPWNWRMPGWNPSINSTPLLPPPPTQIPRSQIKEIEEVKSKDFA